MQLSRWMDTNEVALRTTPSLTLQPLHKIWLVLAQLSYKNTAFLCTTHSLILQSLHKNVVGPCTTHYLILELFSIPKHKHMHAFDLDK